MDLPIEKVLGNRVYLEIPDFGKTEAGVIIPGELQNSMRKKESSLTVVAVGLSVLDVKVGDRVLVDPEQLQKAAIIPISEGVEVACISIFDIMHVWK